MPLSPIDISWYRPNGGEAIRPASQWSYVTDSVVYPYRLKADGSYTPVDYVPREAALTLEQDALRQTYEQPNQ